MTNCLRPNLLIVVLLTICFCIAGNAYYFHKSATPTFWDDSSYLDGSLQLFNAMVERGIPGFLDAFSHLYGNKAPLVCALPTPLYLIFGRYYDPRFLVGASVLILMSIYVFKMGQTLWSAKEGLLAAAIVQTMPLMFGLSRQYLVDYGLATLTVIWMYYLLYLRHSLLTKTCIRLGFILGLGLLMKVTAPLYIALPTVIIFLDIFRKTGDSASRRRLIIGSFYLTATATLVASIWYVPNLKSLLTFGVSASYGRLALNYGSADVVSLAVIRQYWFTIVVCALSSYYFFLLVVLGGLRPILGRNVKPQGNRVDTIVLLSWVLIPLIATTLAINKDVRYTAPFLPAIGLGVARLIVVVCGRRLLPIGAGLLIVPAIAYATATLPAGRLGGDLRLGPFTVWSSHLAWYALAPSNDGAWQQNKIVEALCREGVRPAPYNRVLIPLAHEYLNNVNLGYWVDRAGCQLQVFGIPQDIETVPPLAKLIADLNPRYVVVVPAVPEPELAPEFANRLKEAAEHMVIAPSSGYQLADRESLGATGKEFLIYERR
jgi:4-amino-4-deoxy-L-arabinose transferase-like glycosyltransferase